MSAAVVIPARNEAERVGATVEAAATVGHVDVVVVVDDGSTDATAERARQAGAVVVGHERRRGKGAAMETGAAEVAHLDGADGRPPRHLLFLDADLEGSGARAGALAEPVLAGRADVAVALLPPSTIPGGGRGVVVGLSRWGIRHRTGWAPRQPLSGQRCLTRAAFEVVRPLAGGFGVETAMTIDALARGLHLVEVEVALGHRVTGDDWRGQVHRVGQGLDVARALVARPRPGRRPRPQPWQRR